MDVEKRRRLRKKQKRISHPADSVYERQGRVRKSRALARRYDGCNVILKPLRPFGLTNVAKWCKYLHWFWTIFGVAMSWWLLLASSPSSADARCVFANVSHYRSAKHHHYQNCSQINFDRQSAYLFAFTFFWLSLTHSRGFVWKTLSVLMFLGFSWWITIYWIEFAQVESLFSFNFYRFFCNLNGCVAVVNARSLAHPTRITFVSIFFKSFGAKRPVFVGAKFISIFAFNKWKRFSRAPIVCRIFIYFRQDYTHRHRRRIQ